MRQATTRHIGFKATVVAAACALALSGCSSLPFDLPFELPQLPELPFELPDLSAFPNPFDALGTTTSVADARAAQTGANVAGLTAADLVSEGYLTVGLQREDVSAPFVIEGSGSSIYGIDVDLASAVADELGLMVRFVSVEGVDQPLANGLADVVMDSSPERVSRSTVVGSYYESAAAFFTYGPSVVATPEELNGRTVGVQESSFSQGVLNRSSLGMTQAMYANLNEAFDALQRGEVDYVLCDIYPGAYLAAAYDGVGFAGILGTPTAMGMAVSADNATLQVVVQDALATVLGNGSMDIIRQVWVGGMPAVSVDDTIQGVTVSEAADAAPAAEEPQDGSTAGANAVILY